MNKFFKVIQGPVLYSSFFNSGLMLKATEGGQEYPVEDLLAKDLMRRGGEIVEQNIDFEVIQRTMDNGTDSGQRAWICDKGLIVGGETKSDGFYITVDVLGQEEQKDYKWDQLTPMQHAERVSSPKYLEDIKWRNIEWAYFRAWQNGVSSPREICDWFRNEAPLIL